MTMIRTYEKDEITGEIWPRDLQVESILPGAKITPEMVVDHINAADLNCDPIHVVSHHTSPNGLVIVRGTFDEERPCAVVVTYSLRGDNASALQAIHAVDFG